MNRPLDIRVGSKPHIPLEGLWVLLLLSEEAGDPLEDASQFLRSQANACTEESHQSYLGLGIAFCELQKSLEFRMLAKDGRQDIFLHGRVPKISRIRRVWGRQPDHIGPEDLLRARVSSDVERTPAAQEVSPSFQLRTRWSSSLNRLSLARRMGDIQGGASDERGAVNHELILVTHTAIGTKDWHLGTFFPGNTQTQ